jgi:hypothetical protein
MINLSWNKRKEKKSNSNNSVPVSELGDSNVTINAIGCLTDEHDIDQELSLRRNFTSKF